METISKIMVIGLEDWQMRALQELADERKSGIDDLINQVLRERLEEP